jgi:IS5 family transposase
MRRAIVLTYRAAKASGLTDWRQYQHNTRTLKSALRKIQKIKKGKAKNKDELLIEAYESYVDIAKLFIIKIELTLGEISEHSLADKIEIFLSHAYRQINQIERRAINGEVIPPSEKVYSIFEEHTEWVNKGKAGGKIELGIKVCIIEDQNQFILHHRVMQNEADANIAELIVKECQVNFPNFTSCSFDKGFDSTINQQKLGEILDQVIMPKKGKLSKERKLIEHDPEFISERYKHSAVESGINCLEQHGLDKCLDSGIEGFKRYVSIAIVGRNIQRIGSILRQKARDKEKRRKPRLLKAA